MSALNRTGRWNPGGGHYLELIDATDVTGFARASAAAKPVVTLRAGKAFSRIYCTPGTLGFNQEHSETDNGDLYAITITGFHPDDDVARNATFTGFLQNHRIVVRFKDYATGITRLVGSPDQPLSFSYKFSTGEDVPDSRGYTLTIKGTLTQPAAYE